MLGIKMWVATVDVMKAFDSISHQSLWTTLEKCGVESQYISLLRRLCADQKGTVLTDKESDTFELKRGTKQGDPLSSLLFNTVLQMTLKDDVTRWQKTQGTGTSSGGFESDCFTNLRFADDVLLFSTSQVQLQKNDVRHQAEYRDGRIENGQDENSQQPKFKQKKRNGDQQL